MLMWKAIVAGTATLAIAGTTLVYAQQRSDRDGAQRWRPNTEDMRAFGEARLAALDFGKLRMDRRTAMRNTPPSDDPVERLRQRATAMTDTGAALKKLADATDPLYKSLDENQKRRFAILNRLGGTDRDGFRGRDGGGRDGDGMRHHWGPRRTNTGPTDMEQPGGQRL